MASGRWTDLPHQPVAFVFVLVVGLAMVPLCQAESAGPDTVRVRYDLGGTFDGTVSGSCQAAAIFLPSSGNLTFESDGGQFVHHLVEMNSTQTNASGISRTQVAVSGRVKTTEEQIPNGLGTVGWTPRGRAFVMARAGPFAPESAAFEARMVASSISTGVLQSGTYLVTAYEEFPSTVLWMKFGNLEGVQRPLSLQNGSLEAVGDLMVWMEGATATFADGSSFEVPPRWETIARVGVPAVGDVRVTHVHYGFLDLQNARIQVPVEGAQVLCRGLHVDVDGAIRLSLARGTLEQPGNSLAFEEQELGLWGQFDWREEPRGTGVDAFGEGVIRSATIDYARAVPRGPGLTLEQIGLLAGLLAALGTVVYFVPKGILAFFSRLTESRLVRHPGRALVLETVRANPNVTLHSLTASTGLHKSVVRYHARVLEAKGVLRSHRVLQDRCFVARDTIRAQGRSVLKTSTDLVLRNDAALAEVVRSIPPEGVRLHLLLQSLVSRLAISTPGAWKAVLRAQERGLVKRVQVGREVWIRSPA